MSGARAARDRAAAGAASAARRTVEELAGGAPPLFHNRDWERRFPGIACGITAGQADADFGLATAGSAVRLAEAYGGLAARLGFPHVVVPRQVHGRGVCPVEAPLGDAAGRSAVPGSALRRAGEADGLTGGDAPVLLAVTVADCVPVYLLDPETRGLALLHAGWRGTVAGVLEAGLAALEHDFGSEPDRLWAHFGPAICGACYEVGEEVLAALGRPGGRGHVDLRAELAARALAAGLQASRLSISGWCTRCAGDHFHSHRGSQGSAGRMAAFLGWRPREVDSVARGRPAE